MNKLLGLWIVVALCGCKQKSSPEPAPTSPTGSGTSAPVTAPADAADAAVVAPPAVDAAPPAGPTAAIKLDGMPDDWSRSDEADHTTLEAYAAVNQSKFPVDNAQFTFDLTVIAAAPTNALKTEKLGDATYYVLSAPKGGDGDKQWQVVKQLGDKLYACGGSMYAAGDYKHIKQESAEMVGIAKKICATMKL